MSFEKVETQVDFPAQERAILEFWQRTGAFDKLRDQNRGKPKWSFLDGPITANNPMGVHHAWGRTYKDAYQRYFAMTGHELRYQNGFDCQGLWVEVEVEKELGLRSKRDIENLVPGDPFASIDRFVNLCKERVDKFGRIQTDQSIRLGYWMDWDHDEDWKKSPDQRRSYFTMSEENNYTIWSFLKKCHERGLVYRGYDAMPWCPRCAVGLSQMEMHEGYQLVAHRAVFVRFPLREPRRGENLLVWTTTPWTLTSNVAAAVNPKLTYIRLKHRDQVYYLAKGALTARRLEEEFKRAGKPYQKLPVEGEPYQKLPIGGQPYQQLPVKGQPYQELPVKGQPYQQLPIKGAPFQQFHQKGWIEGVPKLKTLEQIFKEKGGFEILGELSGAEMIGWTYEGPFDKVEAQQTPTGYPTEIASIARRQKWALTNESASQIHRVVGWNDVGETEGTGIVHIAPGCGKEDFLLGKEQGLPPVAPLDEFGAFLPGFGEELWRKSAVDPATTDWIVDNLKQNDLLLEKERYPHSYPHCWRCKTELLFRLVDEWFIDMRWRDEIKEVAGQVTFLPEAINGKARELDWLSNMSDWMISKKRFWGLALPIWACEHCGTFEVIGSREELKKRAVGETWNRFDGHTPHRPWIDVIQIECLGCGAPTRRIPDVGNPWLDAGIVPFSTMKYNTDPSYWKEWFPAHFITESFPGQFRNWFYAILAMSTMLEQKAPMKVLLGHAQVRDEKGEEMHKSKGNAIPFEEAAEKMSADLMRWMFCRHNPANNINFGYGPADEIRNKFVLKLWNTYAFFCNYARLDGFDPATPQVPIKDRPDIDRWILSDLQILIQTARREFERFNVQAFCAKAEEFVDDKLSNWYVRRNRRRFWKSEQSADKQAAYQTLYTVLTTLAKLYAPIMPFLTESIYQNLLTSGERKVPSYPQSVHQCAFPEVDHSLLDQELSADLDTLLWLVSMGLAARNSKKIKVRQPLAEMKVDGDDRCKKVIERFADQIREELNIKKITFHDPREGPLVTEKPVLNMELLAPRLRENLNAFLAAFSKADPAAILAKKRAGESYPLLCPWGTELLLPSEVNVHLIPPDGWAVEYDAGVILIVDCRITKELKLEGIAREIVRHVQNARKEAGLEMEDRIILYLHTESRELREAIEAHKEYICRETLATQFSTKPLGEGAYRVTVKVDRQPLTIELRKI